MAPKPQVSGRKTLRNYEAVNLLFFLLILVALGVFVSFVFQLYRRAGQPPATPSDEPPGIVAEVVSPASDSCIFYLGSALFASDRTYSGPGEIPATDDGFLQELFEIPGVVGVEVKPKVVVLRKSPSARWEAILPGAREVIDSHLHPHP